MRLQGKHLMLVTCIDFINTKSCEVNDLKNNIAFEDNSVKVEMKISKDKLSELHIVLR